MKQSHVQAGGCMLRKEFTAKVLLGVSVLTILTAFFPLQANAWDRHDRRGYNHRSNYPYGRTVVHLPGKYISITFGTGRFFYSEGCFYRNRGRDYAVVQPPVGVVIATVPAGYHKVIIDGRSYYSYNGVYYSRVARGYQVVEPPSSVIVEPDIVSEDVAANVSGGDFSGSFTVNIPDSKRGYTAVTLKRSGSGYVGPQGEFYSEFPKVEQLRAMYVQ